MTPPQLQFPGKILGNLSNDDGDVNENGKSEKGSDSQNNKLFCTYITLFCTSALPSLHDYDEKIPNYFTFCGGGREHKTTTFFFFS